eukprot:CAMPEP_0174375186 /NCGR_PEP_ID=MMETSP0811_2-20130205/113660_1 /TAXON_ID=73025 ORGANISM="Eutreptiella gymnastica-like, Strain CCMP1594" /NCGR_SAMPLE_ID=MMETSP0811_2 /ASSEMBLY_ACC=CAM_ASM_000667 /LENGTH=60 /DNA_ID=CAMNT_0015525183 /DNA_START=281 /DNA_END=460 /DNA_ORIENTATION=-
MAAFRLMHLCITLTFSWILWALRAPVNTSATAAGDYVCDRLSSMSSDTAQLQYGTATAQM